MNRATSKLFIVAAIAAVVMVGGSTAAWAACPTSPSYTPDFSSEPLSPATPSCVTLNNNATIGMPASSLPLVAPAPYNFLGGPNPAQAPPAMVTRVLRLTPNANDQSGSAWFNAAQPVANPFSSTFTFELSGATTGSPADGFAFVIQTVGTSAFKPAAGGCSLGFGDSPDGTCTTPTGGISNSVAVEFDTFSNGDVGDPNGNHVAIQSCGLNANSVEGGPLPSGSCRLADNSSLTVNLADGKFHTATVSFTPTGACSGGLPPTNGCPGLLDVILDGTDLFPNGVAFDIGSIGLNSGMAFVGFTAATGGADDNQDIASWTFSPLTESTSLPGVNMPKVLPFAGGTGTGQTGYDYSASLNAGGVTSTTVNIARNLIDRNSCNKLVQQTFPLAQCFVFENADGNNTHAAVLFAVTCPTLNSGGTCDATSAGVKFFADLGTDFTFLKSDNPFFQILNATIGPYAGWLKGDTGNPGLPCTTSTAFPTLKFPSNQISAFSVVGDPTGTTRGKANPGGSCWVATYATNGELPPPVTISLSPAKAVYNKGDVVTATYTCSNPVTSKPLTSATGPYLTEASCTQASGTLISCSAISPTIPGGGQTCSGTIDTSHTSKLPQAFVVNSLDTGGNRGANVAFYLVH